MKNRLRAIKKLNIVAMAIVMLVLSVLSVSATTAEEKSHSRTYNILCLLSYNYAYNIVPGEMQGIEGGLEDEKYDIDFNITYESMDAKYYYRADDIDKFETYLAYKIGKAPKYDLIITADDTALRFVINNRNQLFKDIPVVFMGVNTLSDATTADALEDLSGVAEMPDYEANYELMKKLFPERKNIVVIVDGTNTGQGEFVQFMEFISNHPDQDYLVLNTSRYSKEGIKQYLNNLGANDVILFLDFLEDGEGNVYTLNNAAKFICQYAENVPVFRVSSADIENGVLGGVSYSFYDAGKLAGQMGARILSGEDPDDIGLAVDKVTTTYFEQNAMDRFKLKPGDLPRNAVILNERFSAATWYNENKLIANLVALTGILFVIIIILLIVANRKSEKQNNIDTLTKIANRLYINKQIKSIVNANDRYGIIMVDLDYFKNINDNWGHLIGDEVLIELAKRLDTTANAEGALAARIGGDEFMILVRYATYEKCQTICVRVQEEMQRPIRTSKGDIDITVSMGSAIYPDDTEIPLKVMSKADKALYSVKSNGRNGFEHYKNIK